MKTTLNKIRSHSPCANGWENLLTHLGKTKADDEPLDLLTILDSNGLDDALWCLRAVEGCDKEIRLYAVWCAQRVQHLMKDPRSIDALDVAERFANGTSSNEELAAARDAAWAAWTAAWPVRAAAWNAAWAAWAAAWPARAAAVDAAWPARAAAVDAARNAALAAGAVAGDARDACAAAREKQENHLREILKECWK